uniref:Putative secreted protein n=1 Tax=Rhipicephalus microplus TaxID=6941 RepID=A0A6M2DEJ8_RHIMP
MKAQAWKFIALLSSAAVVSLLVQKVKSISCDEVDSATCQGIVDPNASLCECCPACMKLRENESSQHLPSGGRRNPRA